jgi:hypothetical protein
MDRRCSLNGRGFLSKTEIIRFPRDAEANGQSSGWLVIGGGDEKEISLEKLKPVATSVATGFCSPQNEIKVTRRLGGARVFLSFF